MFWNKRNHLHKKRVHLPQDWFGTPTWPPFHCFGTPIWPTWRHVKTLYKEQSGVAQASCSLPVDVSYFLFREQHLKEIGRMTSARRRLAFLCPEHPELKSVLIARTERNLIFTPTSWALVRWSRTISLEDCRRLNRRCNIWMGSGFERSTSGQFTSPLFFIFLSLTYFIILRR